MSTGTSLAFVAIVNFLWSCFCIGGTAIAVFGYGHSGSWFLLAILLMVLGRFEGSE